MILARMISLDEDALICDLAETYHIFNYKELPLSLVVVLSCGLKESSRIKLRLSDRSVDYETILLSSIVDKLALILWRDSEDGHKNINKPESLVEKLLNIKEENDLNAYNSIEEYENARKKIIGDR